MPTIEYHNHKEGCFFYSVNSFLSYYINENYYDGCHYVWCTPRFNINPSVSNPKEIYQTYLQDISSNKYSYKIGSNKLGILFGIEKMYSCKVITHRQRLELQHLVNEPYKLNYLPLLYVINKEKVKHKIKTLPDDIKAAARCSEEFIIENLYPDEFDIISFECDYGRIYD